MTEDKPFTLLVLTERVAKGDYWVTHSEAIHLPFLLNQKKGQVCEYYWKDKEVWISLWNITLKIKEDKKNE